MPINDWHTLTVEAALEALQSSKKGLSEKEHADRLKTNGKNILEEKRKEGLIYLFIRQFFNPLILILLLAVAIKYSIGNILDASVIAATILLMVSISYIQEARAKHAIEALRKITSPKAKILLDGREQSIPSHELALGDVIALESGDKVPADCRLLSAKKLKVVEAALTGESGSIEKHTDPIDADHIMADRKNLIYTGSHVVEGKALAVVFATGMQTEIGKIAAALQSIPQEKTPLQKSIHKLSLWMLGIVVLATALFALIGLYRHMPLIDIFLLSISAAVAAIPEGLPASVTVVLAAGAHLMAKKKAIMRKLSAVETLGAASVICSDKTGSITRNIMEATQLFTLERGVAPLEKQASLLPEERKSLEIGALCNDISIENAEQDELGDPTERALTIAALRSEIDLQHLQSKLPRHDEVPFQSERQFMATLHIAEGKQIVYVKGSPEKILSFSTKVALQGKEQPVTDAHKKAIEEAIRAMGSQGLRLIAVGYRNIEATHFDEQLAAEELTFVGIIGIIDPPRPEAIEAIKQCKGAGIKVVMVTGDNQNTAAAIAREIGLDEGNVLSGTDIEAMDEASLVEAVPKTAVFARIEPLHKLKIVEAFKKLGHIVAMTGDGVNDAPALESAHIGIAMGITGTEVSKEASEMILADDNFANIVEAVSEGRAIFDRLRNAAGFLLTTCFGELFTLIFSVLILGVAPLIPIQILWINVITGALIAIPIGMEPKTGNELKVPPREGSVGLLFPGMIYRITSLSLIMAFGTFSIFYYSQSAGYSLQASRTIVFASIVFFEWLIACNQRSDEIPLFRLGVFKNKPLLVSIGGAIILLLCILYIPPLRTPFETIPLSLTQWGIAIIPGLFVFALEIVRKYTFPTFFNYGKWRKGRRDR